MTKCNGRDRHFLSIDGRAIWYRAIDGEITYMVARGDGTDEYFTDWQDAMNWILEAKKQKEIKKQSRSKNPGRRRNNVQTGLD